jgi:U3 small nucleolar RNA-associated protein 3
MAWGNRKNMFYNDDLEKDDEAAEEEEEEAMRLQQEKLQAMDDQDFMDDAIISRIKSGRAGSTVTHDRDEDTNKQIIQDVNEELDKIDIK